MTTTENSIGDRTAARAQMINIIDRLTELLQDSGFQPYHRVEWLHPDTRRHVRFGYANDEWTISVNQLGDRAPNPVSLFDISLDLRVLMRNGPLPTADGLLTRILLS